MDNNQEREINLISLCFRILLKWRWLIICAIICAVLAGGYKYYKDYKAYTAYINGSVESKEETDEQVSDSIQQIEYIEEAIDYKRKRIAFFQSELDETQLYLEDLQNELEEKPILTADLMQVPYSAVCFRVEQPLDKYADYEEVKTLVASTQFLYTNYIVSNEFKQLLAKKTGYIDEKDLDNSVFIYTEVSSNFFTVYAYNLGTADVLKVADAILELINDRENDLHNASVSNVDISYIETLSGSNNNAVLMKYQNDYLKMLSDAQKESDNIVNSINTLYADIANLDKQLDTLKEESVVEEVQISKPSVSKKYVAIGLILGIFLVAGIEALKVVLSNRIQEKEDVETLYNQYYYGNICSAEGSKKFLGFVDNAILKLKNGGKNMSSYPVQVSVVANGIKLSCKKNELKNLVITGTSDAVLDGDSVKTIKEQLEADGINVNVVKNICINTDAMNACEEAGNVVLIEGVGKSYYKDVEEEISKAQAYNIKILGIVSVE